MTYPWTVVCSVALEDVGGEPLPVRQAWDGNRVVFTCPGITEPSGVRCMVNESSSYMDPGLKYASVDVSPLL